MSNQLLRSAMPTNIRQSAIKPRNIPFHRRICTRLVYAKYVFCIWTVSCMSCNARQKEIPSTAPTVPDKSRIEEKRSETTEKIREIRPKTDTAPVDFPESPVNELTIFGKKVSIGDSPRSVLINVGVPNSIEPSSYNGEPMIVFKYDDAPNFFEIIFVRSPGKDSTAKYLQIYSGY